MTERCQLLLPDRLRLSRHGPVLVDVGDEKEEEKVADPFIRAGQRSRRPDTERSHSNITCFIRGFSVSTSGKHGEKWMGVVPKFIPKKEVKLNQGQVARALDVKDYGGTL